MHIIVCYILELLGDDRLLLNVHDTAEQSHQDLVQYFIIVQPWNPLPLWAVQPQYPIFLTPRIFCFLRLLL